MINTEYESNQINDIAKRRDKNTCCNTTRPIIFLTQIERCRWSLLTDIGSHSIGLVDGRGVDCCLSIASDRMEVSLTVYQYLTAAVHLEVCLHSSIIMSSTSRAQATVRLCR